MKMFFRILFLSIWVLFFGYNFVDFAYPWLTGQFQTQTVYVQFTAYDAYADEPIARMPFKVVLDNTYPGEVITDRYGEALVEVIAPQYTSFWWDVMVYPQLYQSNADWMSPNGSYGLEFDYTLDAENWCLWTVQIGEVQEMNVHTIIIEVSYKPIEIGCARPWWVHA